MSPSPEFPRRPNMENIWPPKASSVKDLPKTGFSPTILRDHGYKSKKFVWPPPSPAEAQNQTESGVGWARGSPGGSQRSTPFSEGSSGTPPPPACRPPPFAPSSPVPIRRSTDHIWPPRHGQLDDARSPLPEPMQVRRSWVGRFDNFVKWHASVAVPPTYHCPPGTQHGFNHAGQMSPDM